LTPTPSSRSNRAGGPFGWLFNLFSSIWLGVTLLSLLFLYSSIGSAGLPIHPNLLNPESWISVRQMRFLELTEFEWFHFWPFKLLIALICLNLVVATLRRIPLRVVNLGVWMIHSGIIILAIGSVWYFTTKVEGDTPVARRLITVSSPFLAPQELIAAPGNRLDAGNGYVFRVQSIDREWEIRSGDDAGKTAYAVSVAVQTPQRTFIRQLLAGYPQYTEDVIVTDDPDQPMQRAVKAIGRPLVDETLQMSLGYAPQKYFYIMQSAAIYLRELGEQEWIERPVHGLPRFNDYLATRQDAWLGAGQMLRADPLDVRVPAVSPKDPLPGVDVMISRYLRYARIETRRLPGGTRHDPAVNVLIQSASGESAEYQLLAFDPMSSTAERGLLRFLWVPTREQIDQLARRQDPSLVISVPAADLSLTVPVAGTAVENPDTPFIPIEGTDYAYRVQRVENQIPLSAERVVSLAVVEIKTPQRTFTRWVFDLPQLNRDLAEGGSMPTHETQELLDDGIQMAYLPGNQPAPVTLIAGPSDGELGVLVAITGREPEYRPIEVGQEVLIDAGITLTVQQYAAHTRTETRPFVFPEAQRDNDVGVMSSMVMVDIPTGSDEVSVWLPYHHYPFAGPAKLLRRFPYNPSIIELRDGRRIEIMFSRRRMELPAPVVLDDFQIETHVGGFSGQTSSILNWTSIVLFEQDGSFKSSEPLLVSVNDPKEHDGFWFFQAQWDPPDQPRFEGDPGSEGLNYTVLGVGNRHGVVIQLVGCSLSVMGMLFAFYIKPVIKRRRQARIYADVSQGQRAHTATRGPVTAASSASEEGTS
jgi:hypothetical protein